MCVSILGWEKRVANEGYRERLVPSKMTGSINATYSQGLTDVRIS